MDSNRILTFSLAGKTGRLIFRNTYYRDNFFDNYFSINNTGQPDFTIKLASGNNDEISFKLYSDHEGECILPNKKMIPFGAFNFFLKGIIQIFLFRYNIFLFHASAIVRNKKAYIFCGVPCSGKSTIISYVPKDAILSDDLVAVKKKKNEYHVYTSPMDKIKLPKIIQKSAKLKKIYFLKKSTFTQINTLSISESIDRLFEVSYIFCLYKDFLRTNNQNHSGKVHINSYILKMPQRAIKYLSKTAFDLSTQFSINELEFEKNDRYLALI